MKRSYLIDATRQNPIITTTGDESAGDADALDEVLAVDIGQYGNDGNGGDGSDDDDALELPVDPDEGMPVIPDDERVIDVPS